VRRTGRIAVLRATTRAQWAAITRANAIVGPAWRRSFAGGVVVVNPSTARATAQFGGHHLDGPRAAGSAVVLPPASAVVHAMVDHQ
jgi:hypothetical protein